MKKWERIILAALEQRVNLMRKVLLTSVVALFLAIGTAHADNWIHGRCFKMHPDDCIRGGAPAIEACTEGNQEACALVKKRHANKAKWPRYCKNIKGANPAHAAWLCMKEEARRIRLKS